MIKKIMKLIKQGEGLTVEFKESQNALNRDLYETICAFLNRNGGEILLGVSNHGDIIGVNDSVVAQLKKDFTTAMNNPQKINPTFYLSIEE